MSRVQKHAFVTGANGFVGVNLCRRLLANDWKITVLVRQTSDLSGLDPEKLDVKYGSVTDLESVRKALPQNVDAFFHLAGVTSQWKKYFENQREVNIAGTKNCIDAAAEKNSVRFIHLSSIMSFGLQDGIFNEEAISNAFNINNNYCQSKLKGENIALHAFQSGMDVVIVNPSHIIGPYDQHNHIQLFQAILDDKLPGVPPGHGMFCHVEDVCEAIEKAWESGASGEKYLVGGHYLAFLDLAREIARQLGKTKKPAIIPRWVFEILLPFYTVYSWFTKKEPLLTKGKIMISCSDIRCDDEKARKTFHLNYRSLEEMVSDTLRWLRAKDL